MDSPEEYIDKLILAGAVEVSGITSDGEFTYSFTDKIKEVDAQLQERIDKMFFEEVKELWELGFLNMNVTEENPIVSLTQRALVESERLALDKRLQETLEYVMSILKT
jgi:predicted RNase H-like nuclease